MPKNTDLMGLGLPGPLAGALGNTPTAISATGTTSATAATIPNGLHAFIVTSTAAANGLIFRTDAPIGTPIYAALATGSGLATATFYPQSGGTINTTTSLLLATGKSVSFIQLATATWVTIPTAP